MNCVGLDSVLYYFSTPRSTDWPVSSVSVSTEGCVSHVSSTGDLCLQDTLMQGGRLSLCVDSYRSLAPTWDTLILSGRFINLLRTGVPRQEAAACNLAIITVYPSFRAEVTRLLEM